MILPPPPDHNTPDVHPPRQRRLIEGWHHYRPANGAPPLDVLVPVPDPETEIIRVFPHASRPSIPGFRSRR